MDAKIARLARVNDPFVMSSVPDNRETLDGVLVALPEYKGDLPAVMEDADPGTGKAPASDLDRWRPVRRGCRLAGFFSTRTNTSRNQYRPSPSSHPAMARTFIEKESKR